MLFLALFLNLPTTGKTAPLNLPFDAAYMVAEAGSVEPVSSFDLNGPAPWLYVDLPDGALWSFSSSVNSKWYSGLSTAPKFVLSEGIWGAQDKYWLSPSISDWQANGAVGTWRINATHSLVELVMIYGVGAPRVWGTGSTSIQFSIVDSLEGDFNNDGIIDADDLSGAHGWQERYGSDLSGKDFLTWQRKYVASPESAAGSVAVPEPSTLSLFGALSGLMVHRKRKQSSLWLRKRY